MKTKVCVKLVYDTDTDQTAYRVEVWSIVKPKLSGYAEINVKEGKIPHKITVMAGLIAERFCEKYKDQLDPELVAKAAYEAFVDLELKLRKNGIK